MHTTDTVTETVTVTEPLTETETLTITEDRRDARQSLAARTLPTVEDVEKYRNEIGSPINAQYFFDFYTANGWIQGNGKPIKDWKAVFRYWDRKEKEKTDVKVSSSSIDVDTVEKIMNPYGI